MFEGPSQFGAPEDQLPEPFDYLAEAENTRARREASEKARQETRKLEREERIAKQLARSASKREENARKLKDSKEDVKGKKERVKDEIAETKKTAEEIEKTIKETSDSKPLEMSFGNGSEYIDSELKNGSEAVFELKESVKKAEEEVDTADEVLARAEAINRARAAIHEVETTIESEVAGIVEPHHRPTEHTIYDLGEDQDELRNRFQESWVAPEEESALTSGNTGASTTQTTDYQLPAIPSLATEQLPPYAEPKPAETVITPPRAVNNFRNGAAFVGGIFTGRALGRREQLSSATESLADETQSLKQNIEQIQQAVVAPEQTIPFPMEQAESVSPVSGYENPGYQNPIIEYVPPQRIERPRAENLVEQKPMQFELGNNNPAIPQWIRLLESDLKKGKVPEIKKWQRDVLRVQHPDMLKRYEKLDKASVETIKNQSYETLQAEQPRDLRPLSDFDSEYSAPTWDTSTMPAFMREPSPITPVVYTEQSNSEQGGSVLADNFLTIVMIGGAVFGAVLIIAFGF